MLQVFGWLLLIAFVLVMLLWLMSLLASWPVLVIGLTVLTAAFIYDGRKRAKK